jgi:hypothetical protein
MAVLINPACPDGLGMAMRIMVAGDRGYTEAILIPFLCKIKHCFA